MKKLPGFVLFIMLFLMVGLFSCNSPNLTKTPTATPIPPQTQTPPPSPTPLPDPEWSFIRQDESKDFRRLAFDQDGYLWAIGYGGVVRWNLEEKTYVTYTTVDGLSEAKLKSILIDKNNIPWVASDDGIYSFDGTSWIFYPSPTTDSTRSFTEGANDDFWLCTNGGVYQFDGTEWKLHGNQNGLTGDKCYDMTMDSEGYPWIISASNTVSHYTGNWENIDAPSNLLELYPKIMDGFSDIHISPTGELWIQTLYHISNINPAQNTWHLHIIPKNEGGFTAFALSSSGTPWAVQLYKGKSFFRVFNGSAWALIMPENYAEGLAMQFNMAITDPDGAVWFVGQEAFIRTMQHDWNVFLDAKGAWNEVYNEGIFSDDGTLYFPEEQGILALGNSKEESSRFTKKEGELISNSILNLQIDANGQVYVTELLKYSSNQYAEVLQVYDGNSWTTIHQSFSFSKNARYKWDAVNDTLIAQDGSFWIALQGGEALYRYDNDKMHAFDKSDGLYSLATQALIQDAQDAIWVTHEHGEKISKWDGAGWEVYETGKRALWQAYLSPKGILWFTVDKEDQSLVKYENGIWTDYPTDPGWDNLDDYLIMDVQFNQDDEPIIFILDDDEVSRVYEFGKKGWWWSKLDLNISGFSAILYHQNTLWVGTENDGVYYRVDSEDGVGEWEHLSESNWEGGTHVTLIAAGVEDDIWVATQESINVFRDGAWTFFPQGEDGFVDVTSFAIAPDGSVWFGSESQGLARYGRP